ncbi:MAG TPA: hydroxysqualene dehydroxylase HpnE [Candidatus Binataceae bacterium]|nr:hydroxysqualene dehydroxylase HpnE [Candidatus Binataceae bacterium]
MIDAAIVGGGFAGLSAAVALADRGLRVAVIEAKPSLGGRAFSFVDEESGDFVDNGQHVLMGCYSETLDFLNRIGSSKHLVFHEDLEIELLDRSGASAKLRTARMPGPLHMSGALLRYQRLTMAERMRVMTAGIRMLAMRSRQPERLQRMTVAELMDVLGQGTRARESFWYPLSIATLNDEPQVSSAALLAEVLKRAFFARRSDSAFVYSRVGLSDLYCTGAQRVIQETGGDVVLRKTVESFEIQNGRISAIRFRDGSRLEARNFICATQPDRLLRMLDSNLRNDPLFAKLSRLDTSPIVCIHAWFDREVTDSAFVGFIGTATQWLFNKGKIFEQRGERHPGYLSFVISGARKLVDLPNDQIVATVMNDLHAMIPQSRDAKVLRTLVIKEKNATMAPAPDTYQLRPGVRTPIANLFLAGDWIQTGLPATIESAVIAGRTAAAVVASQNAERISAAA